jgi:imidazole glycerol-phosphate synthase subunit HisF
MNKKLHLINLKSFAMLTKRIIPCLDIKNGRTVKGVNFLKLRDAGDPVELARFYSREGADELVFLDIAATLENRSTLVSLVGEIASIINIPFTVGGGIRNLDDAAALLHAGADKVSINSAAVNRPGLIAELAAKFGSQCVVVAIDAKETEGEYYVYTRGGRNKTNKKLLNWAFEAQQLGAGEILFTSMNTDGVKNGFDCSMLRKLSRFLDIPIIASGGAGNREHFKEVFDYGMADAALAASVFHFREIEIPALKNYLITQQIAVRPPATTEIIL